MGVKDLWSILSPVCERKPLWEFQDSCIAIDLSCWICDSQNVSENNSQCNMYLRNLFFRTTYLLLQGILPIFVLEGEAPVLKHDTIERRKNVRQRTVQSSNAPSDIDLTSKTTKRGNRSRLKAIQTQCAELLTSMGVPSVRSVGEAEALCAQLNQMKIASGVISEDSDCFLYGARTVYRNFTMSSTAGASVDVYQMNLIEDKLKLSRNKMIALSLLLGCDYHGKGVQGIGKESALKFLENIDDSEILPRLQKWRTNKYLDMAEGVKNCLSTNPSLKLEVKIRRKALENPSFPSSDIINEFLKENESLKLIKFIWQQPILSKFVNIATRKLKWEENYSVEKFLPLLTRWHLLHGNRDKPIVELEKIVKKRKPRGIASYEITWKSFAVSTVEPEVLVNQMYGNEVQQYEELTSKGFKKKRASKKGKISEDVSIQAKLAENNREKKTEGKARGSKKCASEKGIQTLDKFLVKLNNLSLLDDSENNVGTGDTDEEMKSNENLISTQNAETESHYDYTDTYYYESNTGDENKFEQEDSASQYSFSNVQTISSDYLTQIVSSFSVESSGCKMSSEKYSSPADTMVENEILSLEKHKAMMVKSTDQLQLVNDVSMCSCDFEPQTNDSFIEVDTNAIVSSNTSAANNYSVMDDSPVLFRSNFASNHDREQTYQKPMTRDNCGDPFLPTFSTPRSKSSQPDFGFKFETPYSIKKTWVSNFYKTCAINESLTASDFECEANDVLDLSEIVENIVSKRNT